jgi:tRNA G46 methylase TrmB
MSPAWTPPEPVQSPSRQRVKGALSGSLLFEQPRHKPEVDALNAFLEPPGPVAVEIGIDHGTVLIDHARTWPEWRWIGIEIRRRKVAAAQPHAPDNALLWAADARSVFATVMPAGRLERIDILFPTPSTKPHHVLFTEGFVEDLGRALSPTGVVTVASDVPGLFAWISDRFSGWSEAPPPARTEVRSRRERVCVRDGLAVQWGHWSRPQDARE